MYNLPCVGAETYFIFKHELAKANLQNGEVKRHVKISI